MSEISVAITEGEKMMIARENDSRLPRGLRLFLVSSLASLTLLLAGASSASALSIGLGWMNYSPNELETVKRSGATHYRLPIDQAAPNWVAHYDPIFQAAWERGITISPYLVRSNAQGTRFLLSSDPGWGSWYTWTKAVIRRYGYNGEFWAGKANPRPVATWEVWNEPNLYHNNPLVGGEEKILPHEYASFLIYTAAAIQAGSQEQSGGGTQVLFAGLYMTGTANYPWFLEKAYEVPGLYSSYHGLSIHPYAFNGKMVEFTTEIGFVREKLNTLPWGSSRSLWITEMGWPVAGDAPTVTEAQQATLLTEAYNWVKGAAGALNIQAAFWYNIQDGALHPNNWAENCGLRDRGGAYRPSWRAFQEQTGAAPWPLPSVVTGDATSIQETQATLHGTINPNSWQTSYRFEYGTSTAYGTSMPVPNAVVGSDSVPIPKSVTITNLQPNTHYHYRVVGTSPAGTTYGGDRSFTTGVKWHIRNSNSGGAPDAGFWFGLPGQTTVVGDWDGNGTETPGAYDPATGVWKLRNSNSTGSANITFQFGGSQFKPITGDWDGNGTTTIGLYEPTAGTWILRNANDGNNGKDISFQFGGAQFKPLTGDWDGDGTTTIGLFEENAGTWILRNANDGNNGKDISFQFGGSQFMPLTGDWDGNGTTTIGLYEKNAGSWILRNANDGNNGKDISFQFGGSQFTPLTGDWDGKGGTSIGLADPNSPVERNWLSRNSNSGGSPDLNFWFGWPGETAVVGDWDGNGTETPGVYYPATGTWKLRNSNSSGPVDISFQFGGAQFTPITGDWDGNGTTTIGLYEKNAGTWILRNANDGNNGKDISFQFGGSQFTPITGDWNGNGTTTIGLFEKNAGTWALRNSNSSGPVDISFQFGGSQFTPLTGDWDGKGGTTIGLYEKNAGSWILRNANNGTNGSDISFQFGGSQYDPVTGDWDGNGTVTVSLVTK